jgi:hypothetical protein
VFTSSRFFYKDLYLLRRLFLYLETIWDILANCDILVCTRTSNGSSYQEDVHLNEESLPTEPNIIKSYLFSCIKFNGYECKQILVHIYDRLSNRLQYSVSIQEEIDPPKFTFPKMTIKNIDDIESDLRKKFLLCLKRLGYDVS